MKNIGYLKTSQKNAVENLTGEINTLSVKLAIRLLKKENKTSEKAPDYTFMVQVKMAILSMSVRLGLGKAKNASF